MPKRSNPQVGILMGSDSDWPAMKGCADLLGQFGAGYEVRILSAHRTPEDTAEYAKSARERGLQMIIAAAGMAAHLAGAVAAQTTLIDRAADEMSQRIDKIDLDKVIDGAMSGAPPESLASIQGP